MRATNVILRINMTAAGVDVFVENNVDRDPIKVAEDLKALMSASEHAGAARAHLENANKVAEAGKLNAGDMPAKVPAAPAAKRSPRKRPARKAAKKSGGNKSSSRKR